MVWLNVNSLSLRLLATEKSSAELMPNHSHKTVFQPIEVQLAAFYYVKIYVQDGFNQIIIRFKFAAED